MFLEIYLNGFKRYALYERELSPNTIKDIINAVKRLNAFVDGDSIHQFTTDTIRNYLYTQRETLQWSPRTFINQRQYIKIFFDYALIHQYIKSNPVNKIKRPKTPDTLPRFLTSKQVSSILIQLELCTWRYNLEKYRNKTIIYVLLFTGVRLNELVNLKITDVNMEDREIIIKKGKGRKERMIPIHSNLYPLLEQYLAFLCRDGKNCLWLFQNLRGERQMKGRSVQLLCEKLSKKSGIKFTPHQLRHTFGRNCTNAEISAFKIKELMGHANITTTQIYQSVAKKSLKDSFCNAVLL